MLPSYLYKQKMSMFKITEYRFLDPSVSRGPPCTLKQNDIRSDWVQEVQELNPGSVTLTIEPCTVFSDQMCHTEKRQRNFPSALTTSKHNSYGYDCAEHGSMSWTHHETPGGHCSRSCGTEVVTSSTADTAEEMFSTTVPYLQEVCDSQFQQ